MSYNCKCISIEFCWFKWIKLSPSVNSNWCCTDQSFQWFISTNIHQKLIFFPLDLRALKFFTCIKNPQYLACPYFCVGRKQQFGYLRQMPVFCEIVKLETFGYIDLYNVTHLCWIYSKPFLRNARMFFLLLLLTQNTLNLFFEIC